MQATIDFTKNVHHIGHGLVLIPTNDVKDITSLTDYCYLYKDDEKISDTLFRKGGLFRGFKDDNYCQLISYKLNGKKLSGGQQCIIDINGNVILMAPEFSVSFYFLGGCIATLDKKIYNLLTNEIITKDYYSSLSSKDFLFYHTKNGVIKINKKTGEYEIFE